MIRRFRIVPIFFLLLLPVFAQQSDPSLLTLDSMFTYRIRPLGPVQWQTDGSGYLALEPSTTKKNFLDIVRYDLNTGDRTVKVSAEKLTPTGAAEPLAVEEFSLTPDEQKLLIFTNSERVWRSNTRGDYWVLDLKANTLKKLGGTDAKPSSLMFAKFSPDGQRAAYVRENNIYAENLGDSKITKLTNDGARYIVNGTFDWVYEEEFFCRDGFRWSPDSKQIAYWQIDARQTKDYLMVNNTDSIYPFAVPVEYPIAGEPPSPFKIGVVDIANAKTKWIDIPTDAVLQSYVPRMEWAANSNELIVQHLNRRQNQSDLLLCNAQSGAAQVIYTEKDSAWIDILPLWDNDYTMGGWDWINGGKEF